MPKFALLSVTAVLRSVRFLAVNPWAITRRILAPALLGILALYFLLAGYLNAVSAYLAQPTGGSASRVLGIGAVGILVMLFLHSQLVSAVAAALVPSRGGAFLGIRQHEWRLYAANLQLLLLICFYVCVFWPAAAMADFLALPPLPRLIMYLMLLVVLFWIVLRAWFFLVPLSISTSEGEMLVRSWRVSAGHFWSITALIAMMSAIVLAVYFVLQIAFVLTGIVPPLPTSLSMSAALDAHRSMLLPFVLLVSITYIVAAVLSALARIFFYQEIAGVPGKDIAAK